MRPSPFDWDVFISYAHIDNRHYSGVPQGWVDFLHERLGVSLAKRLGRLPKIWRDRKLRGNDAFNDEIKETLSKTAIFLAVVSPRYLASTSCRAEIDDFMRATERQGGVRIGNRYRVFKVAITEVPLSAHPTAWQGLLGYEFYEKDPASARVREFDHLLIGNERDKRYWDRFEDLSWDLKETLDVLNGDPGPPSPHESQSEPPPAALGTGITVYLAETTSDLGAERDSIRRDLQQHGHPVLPDQPLPMNAPALEQAARGYLQQASLAIHLVGAHYGIVPEMERSRSAVSMQLALAAERCGEAGFSRLIWMPVGLGSEDERQRALIDELQGSAQAGSDLLQTKLEELKTVIHEKLAPQPKPAAHTGAQPGVSYVYLLCDKADYDATRPIEDYLSERGIAVLPPLLEGEGLQVSQYHRESLQLCDALMIFYGSASDTWAQLKRLELLKLAGLGRERPLLAKAFYLSTPATSQKERFRCPDALVIKEYGGFNQESLAPFLAPLQGGQA
ncbi:MAG: TIR domain-containing protein [Gammaproteobacteria bacterium]